MKPIKSRKREEKAAAAGRKSRIQKDPKGFKNN
jgi:hypothetical protein